MHRLFCAAFALLICSSPLVARAASVPEETARLVCTVQVSTAEMACTDVVSAPRLRLAAEAGRYQGGVWSAEVTLQNLTPYTLGTADGHTPDPSGVRAEILGRPVATAGSGTVQAPEAVRFAGVLAAQATTTPQRVQFAVPATVEAFSFTVAVRAVVYLPQTVMTLGTTSGTVVAGSTLALSGGARSARGLALGAAWSTSTPAVATVDASGLVTAVLPGNTTITATSGSQSKQATIYVCPNLAVGEVYTFEMPYGAGFCLQGGTSGAAEYTVIPTNQSTSSNLSLTSTASGIQAVTGPPTPNVIPEGGLRLGVSSAQMIAAAPEETLADLPDALQRAERAELARLGSKDLIRPGIRPRATGADGTAQSHLIPQGVPSVGDRWTLNVASGCSGTRDDRVGYVVAVTSHAIVVEDSLNPAGGFFPYNTGSTIVSADSLARMFDRIAYTTISTAFGAPTDLDNNGRIVLFYTRAVNELSPPASSVVTLGYVTARDLYSSDPASCPRSNEGEIAYMLVPDPTGAVNSNVRTVSYVVGGTVGTAGHEFAHLISNSRRLYFNGQAPFQEAWLEEGTAHIAEELMFYSESGMSKRVNIALGTNATYGIQLNSKRVAAFNTYANANFGRLKGYLQRPDTTSIFQSTVTSPGLSMRGAMWSFLRYAVDRYATEKVAALGGDASTYESTFWAALVTNATTTGIENLRQALGLSTYDEVLQWFRDWEIAMYADDAGVSAATTYTNPSWNYRSMCSALACTLVPRTLTNNTGLTLSYKKGGGNTWQRLGVAQGSTASYTITASGTTPSSTVRLSVVRTK